MGRWCIQRLLIFIEMFGIYDNGCEDVLDTNIKENVFLVKEQFQHSYYYNARGNGTWMNGDGRKEVCVSNL